MKSTVPVLDPQQENQQNQPPVQNQPQRIVPRPIVWPANPNPQPVVDDLDAILLQQKNTFMEKYGLTEEALTAIPEDTKKRSRSPQISLGFISSPEKLEKKIKHEAEQERKYKELQESLDNIIPTLKKK